jgi:hypothetical protein
MSCPASALLAVSVLCQVAPGLAQREAQPHERHTTTPTRFEAGRCGLLAQDCDVLDRLFPLRPEHEGGGEGLGWMVVGRRIPAGRGELFYWVLQKSGKGRVNASWLLTRRSFWEQVARQSAVTETATEALLDSVREAGGVVSSHQLPALGGMAHEFERLHLGPIPRPQIVSDADIYDLRTESMGGTVEIVTTEPDKALRQWVRELERLLIGSLGARN